MTGDDHANGGTAGRFATAGRQRPAGLLGRRAGSASAATSYVYPGAPLTDAQAAAFEAQGFEIALHLTDRLPDAGRPPRSQADFTAQLAQFAAQYPSVPRADARTGRTASRGATGRRSRRSSSRTASGSTRTTTTARPTGCRTGRACSPAPACRCASPTRTARSIDVYQATTQMTDESEQAYPLHDRRAARQGRRRRRATTAPSRRTCTPTPQPARLGRDRRVGARARRAGRLRRGSCSTWLDGRNALLVRVARPGAATR